MYSQLYPTDAQDALSVIKDAGSSDSKAEAAVRDLLAYGLKLSSFPKIKAMDPDADHPTRDSIDTNPQPRNREITYDTSDTTQSPQTDVTDTQLKEVGLVTNANEQALHNNPTSTIARGKSRKSYQSVATGHVKRRSSDRKNKKVPIVVPRTIYVKFSQC